MYPNPKWKSPHIENQTFHMTLVPFPNAKTLYFITEFVHINMNSTRERKKEIQNQTQTKQHLKS